MKQNLKETISNLKNEIYHLKEYLVSDCCRQCSEIISKIEKHQQEIKELEENLTHEKTKSKKTE